jgi:hypothetical protein
LKAKDNQEIILTANHTLALEWYEKSCISSHNTNEKARERIQIIELERISPDCPICYEKLNPRGMRFLLIPGCCGATFHYECIKTATASKKRCPVCRKLIGTVG